MKTLHRSFKKKRDSYRNDSPLIVDRDRITAVNFHLNDRHSS